MKRNPWYLITGFVAVLGLVALVWGRIPGERSAAALPPAPLVSHPAPPFVQPDLAGDLVALADLRGQPLVLNFWATWCGPCRAEMPELQRLHERLGPAGVVVLGANQGEPAERVAAYRRELGVDFPTLLDERFGLSQDYAVSSLPTTYFIDREGVIRNVVIGAMSDAMLADKLRSIYP